ncbi:MAG TPA: hypothetical protein VK549_08340 [Acidimicrobiia bacterium]|nr:hypothetical protein [Acidimicrobiia bacterium]
MAKPSIGGVETRRGLPEWTQCHGDTGAVSSRAVSTHVAAQRDDAQHTDEADRRDSADHGRVDIRAAAWRRRDIRRRDPGIAGGRSV